MHEDLLHSIAGGRVVCFGIDHQTTGGLDVGLTVDVHVADAVRMAHHWDLGVLLDVGHQSVAATGNDLPYWEAQFRILFVPMAKVGTLTKL